jgi:uncharacterized membrane protein HdeD (DUF308 family)
MAGFIRVESAGNFRGVFLALGIPALLVGTILILFPVQSLWLMLTFAGILLLVLGAILLAGAAKMVMEGTPAFLLPLIAGSCAMVFGALVFLNPGLIGAFFAVILGFACLVSGLAAAGTGLFRGSPLHRALMFAGGCLLAGLGVLMLLHPQGAAELTVRLGGLLIAAAGLVLLALGITTGRPKKDPLENPEFRVIEER